MAFEILKTSCVENAETYREEVMAGKRPAIYTKKQFFEELEEANKKEPITHVFFLEITNNLTTAIICLRTGEELDEHLAELDENMLHIDNTKLAFVRKAKFKAYS